MNRVAPILALALCPTAVRADAGLPGARSVPQDAVIDVRQEYPTHVFVFHARDHAQVLTLSPGQPARLRPEEWAKSTRIGAITAVPVKVYAERDAHVPLAVWVEQLPADRRTKLSG